MTKDFDIKKLKGSENYHTWAFAVKNFLDYKGFGKCIEVVTNKDGTVAVKETDEEKLRSCEALLSLLVEENIFTPIKECNSALAIWDTLKKRFDEQGLSRKIGILRSMLSCRLEDKQSMQCYIEAIMDDADKLNGVGFKNIRRLENRHLIDGTYRKVPTIHHGP